MSTPGSTSIASPPEDEALESGVTNRPWALLAIIVLCLFAFLLAKALFHLHNSNKFFYLYGLAVTSVVLMQMTIAFFFYRDPYLRSLDARRHLFFDTGLGDPIRAPRHAKPDLPVDTGWDIPIGVPRHAKRDLFADTGWDISFGVPLHAKRDPFADTGWDIRIRAPRPLVTCLVAVYNDEAIIGECLRSVCSQTYPNIEVIVVNDASTDGTQHVLNELATQLPIRVVELKNNVGKKAALVRGASFADGEIFAFTDSDSTWDAKALNRIVTAMEADLDLGAVSGHCRARNAEATLLTKIQDTWYEGQFAVRKAFESTFGAVTCVSGPLAVFRREAIYNLLPAWERDRFLGDDFRFATDRTLTGYVLGAEQIASNLIAKTDSDSPFLVYRYPIRKWNVAYCKSARGWTQVPETLSAVLRQQIRWKKSFLRNIFLTGRFYWRRPIPPAAVYYLHILFVTVGPFVAFRHMIYLPLHGNVTSMFLYLFGIMVIGSAFAFAHKAEEPTSTGWVYRPLMSLFSTLLLSWLIFYSVATIKKMTWARA